MDDPKESSQAKLEQELARRTRSLSTLYAVLTAYHQVDDLDEMMKLVLNQVLKISLGRIGSIHLLDESGDTLHLAASEGIDASVLGSIRQVPVDDQIGTKILKQHQPFIISEMSTNSRLAEIAQVCERDVFIGVPILSGKTAWGVLVICGDQTLLENPEEIKMLEIIARQIGAAIENSYLREQSEQLSIIEERNRIARELHDSVTQSLYSLTLFSETARRMMDADDPAETRRYLGEIADASQQALKEMRLLVYKLRPGGMLENGVVASIEQRLRAVEARSGIHYDLQVDQSLSLHPNLEKTIYAVTVEALNNSIKHAQADHVRVILARDGPHICLEICDNGVGFDVGQARQTGGLGLVSIQERVAELQGEIQIDSAPGSGTTIRVRFLDGS